MEDFIDGSGVLLKGGKRPGRTNRDRDRTKLIRIESQAQKQVGEDLTNEFARMILSKGV